MGTNPRDPVVLIRSNPLERVDREVGLRVRERIKRIRTGPQPVAQSPRARTTDAPDAPDGARSDSRPPA